MPEKLRLLLVDDDSVILTILSEALASPAWEISTATDALQALMKARELRPFCIISDLQMPAYGKGSDMIRALRQEKAISATPVIVLTGMPPERAQRLLPPDDAKVRLLNKPPDFDAILALIQELTGVDGRAAAA